MSAALSGSKPGEFTTSLSTLTLKPPGGNVAAKRYRRDSNDDPDVEPSGVEEWLPQAVETTALPCWLPPLEDIAIAGGGFVLGGGGGIHVPQLEGSMIRETIRIVS